MTVEELPGCIVQYPACGCCGADTRNDGDGFYCEECGLSFGDGREDVPGEFLDEEEQACGKPCDNSWHPTLGLTCGPCKLPASHTSGCWTGCKL
jgi:hypothetical protein